MPESRASDRPVDQAASSRTSRRILQATLQLYREIGHNKTTVADIARRAGMSPANVYRFFRSRRQIEEAVVAEALDDVFKAAAIAAGGRASPAHRLEAVIRAIAERHVRRRANDIRLHELVADVSEARWPVALAHGESIVGLLASLIAAGQAEGEIGDGSADTLARCLFVAMNAHLGAARVAAVGTTLDEMISFCLSALCPAPFIRRQACRSCPEWSQISAALAVPS